MDVDYKKILSLSNDKVKYFVLLKQPKNALQNKEFLIESHHLVELALNNNIVKYLIGTKEELRKYNFASKIEITQQISNKISDVKTPQNIFAVCETLPENFDLKSQRYLILDDIQDPGNLGTLIRSANAFGFTHIIMSPNTVSIYNPKVIRATQGLIFNVNFSYIKLSDAIVKLKQNDVKILTTYLHKDNSVNYKNFKVTSKIAVVLGNEGSGISQELLNLSDFNVNINTNNVESLNVGVAGSILMSEYGI